MGKTIVLDLETNQSVLDVGDNNAYITFPLRNTLFVRNGSCKLQIIGSTVPIRVRSSISKCDNQLLGFSHLNHPITVPLQPDIQLDSIAFHINLANSSVSIKLEQLRALLVFLTFVLEIEEE